MVSGRFITFEGGDGCGKTTQSRRLLKTLETAGVPAVLTHEPGGTPGADAIRALLVQGDAARWNPMSELLLHFAARADHVERVIRPALEAGTWVICDRFVDSTLAYQGYGQGVEAKLLHQLHQLSIGGMEPELTLVFDMDTETALARARVRDNGKNRYEKMDVGFHRRLHEGFRKIARENPERCVTIDASGTIDAVHEAVITAVNTRLGTKIRLYSVSK